MTHWTKIIGLLLAVLALSAWDASVAQAAPEFEALETIESNGWPEEVPVHATVKATEVKGKPAKFTLGGLPISCTSASGTATLETGSSPSLSLAPSFSECKVILFGFPVEVGVGACHYNLNTLEETEVDNYTAHAEISCPAGNEINFTVKNLSKTKTICVIHVPAQKGLSAVKIKDVTEASPDNLSVTNEVKEIEAVVTNGEEKCLISPGTYKTGQYTGTTTMTATNKAETPPINYDVIGYKKFHFAFEIEHAFIKGTQDSVQKFKFDLGTVECAEVLFEEQIINVEKIAQFFHDGKSYGNCQFNGEEAAVIFNTCLYKLTAKAIEFGALLGRTFIQCGNNEEPIEVKTTNCIVTIREQEGVNKEGLRGITYQNLGAGATREITANLTINFLHYEELGEGCKSTGTTANGLYTGSITFKARDAGNNQIGLWAEKTP